MSKTRIVLVSNGVKEMLKSKQIEEFCLEQAKQIQQRAGEGYGIDTHVGKTRVNASVFPNTAKSIRNEKENNILLKSLR